MKDIYSYRKSLLAKTPTLKQDELKKEGKELYAKKVEEDTALLEAYTKKKLKSKTVIKKAKALAEAYAKKEDKEA